MRSEPRSRELIVYPLTYLTRPVSGRKLPGSKSGADCWSQLQHGQWVQNTETNKFLAPNNDLYCSKMLHPTNRL